MPLPFVGVDGEGGDVDNRHVYTMLRAGDDYVTDGFIPFLASLAKKRIHVAFFFDYDVTMMLRHLPPELLSTLVKHGEAAYERFRYSYRPRKEFIVRSGRSMTTINDVGTFFQCKFATALRRWNVGTEDQLRIIEEGKEGRQHFGQLTAETIEYNRMETRLLEELMEKFRRVCMTIGYMPQRWQGPGQLAKAMFRAHNIPKTEQLPTPPDGLWEMAQAAYYGGRFETSAVGKISVPVDGWDINSAYPYAATLLPCLLHGRWLAADGRAIRRAINDGHLVVCGVRFDHRTSQRWYTLPVRCRDGSIRYPKTGAGWYWSPELKAAESMGCVASYQSGFIFQAGCDCRPFNFMYRLFSVRKGLGKTEAGHGLKLAMNSAYGVCAQSVGKAPYANPVWAGLFTAYTRALLIDALSHSPEDVYMLATDGLYARSGHINLHESSSLGGWEKTMYPGGMHIVQPGVYFTGHKSTCIEGTDCDCGPKTRGVPRTAVLRDETQLKAAWHGQATDHHSVSLRQFIGLRLGCHRGNFEDIGQWLPVSKAVSYDWSTKRRPDVLRRTAAGWRTEPYTGDSGEWTVPYSRIIGGNLARNMERLEWADTPDWALTLTDQL